MTNRQVVTSEHSGRDGRAGGAQQPSLSALGGRAPDVPLISVVVPCFNEEEVLGETHARLVAALDSVPGCEREIVFVDDGSRDGTWERLVAIAQEDGCVRLIRFSRNFGHQASLLAGLGEARGDVVVMMDADLQDPPELIPHLVERWRDGWAVVSGRRCAREGETYFKRGTAFVFYRLLEAFATQPVALDTGDFRLLDRSVVDVVVNLNEYQPYLRGLISWVGFSETSVDYIRAPRRAGDSKYSARGMLELGGRAFASCTWIPAWLPTVVGLTSLAGATVTSTVLRRRVPVAVWTFSGQSLLLGALAQHSHLVYSQVRGRPSYVIQERFPRSLEDAAPRSSRRRVAPYGR